MSDQVQVDEMRDVQQLSKVAIVKVLRYRRPTQNQSRVCGWNCYCMYLLDSEIRRQSSDHSSN